MQKTFLNRIGYLLFIGLFVIVGVYIFNLALKKVWLKDEPALTYEKRPDIYKFVLFPKNQNVPVYEDEAMMQPMGTLAEAVVVNGQEIKTGVVRTGLFISGKYENVYVKLSDLSYLLDDGSTEQFIAKYNDTSRQINYSELMSWIAKRNKDGRTVVEYVSKDDKHARSTSYSYVTDGTNINTVYSIKSDSGITGASYFLYNFLFGIFLFGITFFFKKYFFQN